MISKKKKFVKISFVPKSDIPRCLGSTHILSVTQLSQLSFEGG